MSLTLFEKVTCNYVRGDLITLIVQYRLDLLSCSTFICNTRFSVTNQVPYLLDTSLTLPLPLREAWCCPTYQPETPTFHLNTGLVLSSGPTCIQLIDSEHCALSSNILGPKLLC